LKVVKVACGASHSLCITDKGKLFSWGDNHLNQLGLELDAKHVGNPMQVAYLDFQFISDVKPELASF
jgi:alpha-tubulin suppressor-like RCC1 family protein